MIKFNFKMAACETGISDLFDDIDMEETCDTGYEKDVDVAIIDGFYYQKVAFVNGKVRLLAGCWMKLYSNHYQHRTTKWQQSWGS